MAYEMVMPYHLHMPSYFLETFTEYPYFTITKMAEVSDFSHSVKGYSNIPAISSAICLSVNRLAFISSSRL